MGCDFLLQGGPAYPVSPALAAGFLTTVPPGKPGPDTVSHRYSSLLLCDFTHFYQVVEFIFSLMHLFSRAAVTNYHNLGGLKQQKLIFLEF